MDGLVEYYSQRAHEYEEIYERDDAVRHAELAQIADVIRRTFVGRRVLEIACGTGFWTKTLLEVAKEVVATDASAAMLEVAREKLRSAPDKLRFAQADAYNLAAVQGDFDAALANFWLSHVPRARLHDFFEQFHHRIGRGAVVFMGDNVNVPGVGGEFVRPSDSEDSYKIRRLKDGSTHKIIKNYPNESELRELLASRSCNLKIGFGQAYWWLSYMVT
jgi:SAM-dependent methyltransferase